MRSYYWILSYIKFWVREILKKNLKFYFILGWLVGEWVLGVLGQEGGGGNRKERKKRLDAKYDE
jgi:hypothetical protein